MSLTPKPAASFWGRENMSKHPAEITISQASDAAVHLLGGAQRVRTRVRGFAPWSPEQATLALLDQVRGVLDEYEAYLPLSIRQIFYRLVGAHDYEKTEPAYQRLAEHLNRARRARIIPMDVIRDDGGIISEPDAWESAEQFMAIVHAMAKKFTLDHSTGQATRLVVICEAAGMAPQLARVAHPFGVTVMSGGGFESTTDRHKFAAALASYDRPTEVLDIGYHDPSGAHRFLAHQEDIKAFTKVLCATSFAQLNRNSTDANPREASMEHARLRDRAAAITAATLQIIDTAPVQLVRQQIEEYLRDEIADLQRQIAGKRESSDA